jgi:hypothetical protein
MPNMWGRNRDPCLCGKNLLNQQTALAETGKPDYLVVIRLSSFLFYGIVT